MLTPDMVRDGAVVLDVGASRPDYRHQRTMTGGFTLVGDVHPDVYSKCSLYSPVPGGVCGVLFPFAV